GEPNLTNEITLTNKPSPTNKPGLTNLPLTPPPIKVETSEHSQAPQLSKHPVFSDPALQPEYKQVPAPKQSKVIKLDNVPEISTKFKKKHGHCGKRGPRRKKN
ncbi:hypothetical protein FRC12_023798, partial [Ceratobasidium sp. 428]